MSRNVWQAKFFRDYERRVTVVMKVTRRQFLKVAAGAIGATVATEAITLGAEPTSLQNYT
jgi:hypothetical protein